MKVGGSIVHRVQKENGKNVNRIRVVHPCGDSQGQNAPKNAGNPDEQRIKSEVRKPVFRLGDSFQERHDEAADLFQLIGKDGVRETHGNQAKKQERARRHDGKTGDGGADKQGVQIPENRAPLQDHVVQMVLSVFPVSQGVGKRGANREQINEGAEKRGRAEYIEKAFRAPPDQIAENIDPAAQERPLGKAQRQEGLFQKHADSMRPIPPCRRGRCFGLFASVHQITSVPSSA